MPAANVGDFSTSIDVATPSTRTGGPSFGLVGRSSPEPGSCCARRLERPLLQRRPVPRTGQGLRGRAAASWPRCRRIGWVIQPEPGLGRGDGDTETGPAWLTEFSPLRVRGLRDVPEPLGPGLPYIEGAVRVLRPRDFAPRAVRADLSTPPADVTGLVTMIRRAPQPACSAPWRGGGPGPRSPAALDDANSREDRLLTVGSFRWLSDR